MTPNLLARTIETIEGGGMVILLMQSVKSLRQLYTISMDVHNRYRTEAHNEITARFNERFILSLASCSSILVLDDQLRVLPISSHIESVEPISNAQKVRVLCQKFKFMKTFIFADFFLGKFKEKINIQNVQWMCNRSFFNFLRFDFF